MHSLLPIQLQNNLKFASKSGNLDAVIRIVQSERPDLFHTEATLGSRVFFDQPRGAHSGKFINAAPPLLGAFK
jgi:hypothetical protein